jgi:WD40 repeat protein
MLVSTSNDKTVQIWDTKTGKHKHILGGHSDLVGSAVFSHDSMMVVSSSFDKTVRIWNTKTGECDYVLEGHSNWVPSAVFSNDSMLVASASRDGTVRIWDPKTGNCVCALEGYSSAINSVLFSHDSTMVASFSEDKTIRIWNLKTRTCREAIPLDYYTELVSFTPDKSGIITSHGTLTFTNDLLSHELPTIPLQPYAVSVLGLENQAQVTSAGEELLWLPTECRGGRVVISANSVAIGCPFGRLIILGFSCAVMDKL